jgi:ATP-dependent Clp protease adaptor protein ClpS
MREGRLRAPFSRLAIAAVMDARDPGWHSAGVVRLLESAMRPPVAQTTTAPPKEKLAPKTRPRTERPKLYKVILLNDDFTPREFVVTVLKGVFRMTESEAYGVMLTAHRRGACVVAVFTREVAETKAQQANAKGQAAGYPLTFTTEREE